MISRRSIFFSNPVFNLLKKLYFPVTFILDCRTLSESSDASRDVPDYACEKFDSLTEQTESRRRSDAEPSFSKNRSAMNDKLSSESRVSKVQRQLSVGAESDVSLNRSGNILFSRQLSEQFVYYCIVQSVAWTMRKLNCISFLLVLLLSVFLICV